MAKEPLAIWQHVVALLQDTKTKLTNMIQSEARAREDMDTLIDERLDGIADSIDIPWAIKDGGTGGTTQREAQYNLLNDIRNTTSPPADGSTMLFWDGSGNKENGAIFKKPITEIWKWFKDKIGSEVLPDIQGQIDDTYSAGVNLVRGTRDWVAGVEKYEGSNQHKYDGFTFGSTVYTSIEQGDDGFAELDEHLEQSSVAARIIAFSNPLFGEWKLNDKVTISYEFMVKDFTDLDFANTGTQIAMKYKVDGSDVSTGSDVVWLSSLGFNKSNIELEKWYKAVAVHTVKHDIPDEEFLDARIRTSSKKCNMRFRKLMVQRGEVRNPVWSPSPFDYYMEDHVTGINLARGTRDFTMASDVLIKYEGIDGFVTDSGYASFVRNKNNFAEATLAKETTTNFVYIRSSEIPLVEIGESLTISCEVRRNSELKHAPLYLSAYDYTDNTSTESGDCGTINHLEEGKWHQVSFVFTRKKDYGDHDVHYHIRLQLGANGSVSFRKLMVQKGIVKQPIWSPSPFDNLQLADIPEASAEQAGIVTTGEQTIAGQKNFTSTVILSKTQDLDGTKDNRPALIVGNTPFGAHLELDANEIHAKQNGTTPAMLYLNWNGGDVGIGPGNFQVSGISTFTGVPHFKSNIQLHSDGDNEETSRGIFYRSKTRNAAPIEFYPQSNTASGVRIGDGGRVVIGSGESSTGRAAEVSGWEVENLDLLSDQNIYFYTNCNTYANKVESRIDNTGSFYPGKDMVLQCRNRLMTYDKNDTLYSLICDNGSNFWLGAQAQAQAQRSGQTFIATGYSGTKGYETINVAVPNADNTSSDLYPVLHSGNWDKYITLENPIVPHTVIALVNFSAGAGIKLGESYSQYYTSTFKLSDLADSAKKGDVDALPGGTSSVNKAYVSVDAHVNNDSIYVANAFVDAVGNFFDSSPIKFTLMPYPGVSFANTAFSVTFKITWFG